MREIKFRGKARYNEKSHKLGDWIFGDVRINNKKQAFICEKDLLETEIFRDTVRTIYRTKR